MKLNKGRLKCTDDCGEARFQQYAWCTFRSRSSISQMLRKLPERPSGPSHFVMRYGRNNEVSGHQTTNSGSSVCDVSSGNHVGTALKIGALGTHSPNLSTIMNKLHVLNAARLHSWRKTSKQSCLLLPNSLSAMVKVGLFNLDHHPASIR